MSTDKKTCIIMGAGLGGLLTGAFLAKNGIKVIMLEKNAIIGGGLQSFTRRGRIFETGMHVLGGFLPGGNLHKICSYLGILDSLRIQHIDSECIDEVHFEKTGDTYRIPSGREKFIDALSRYFPSETEGIRRYVDHMYALTRELPLYYLKSDPNPYAVHSEEFGIPADEFIDRFIDDSRLKELLAYLSPLYSGMRGKSPAYIHALINVLYINGTSRFIGGSLQMADALAKVITDNGGCVYPGKEVKKIILNSRTSVQEVITTDGTQFKADWYIADFHPAALLRMLPADAFNRAYRQRILETPNTASAFSLYIDLKDNMFDYIPHTCYLINDYGDMWNQHEISPDKWPAGIMYMTPPDPDQGKYASRFLVHCLMDFKEAEQWADSTINTRPLEYNEWKEKKITAIINRLAKRHPGLREAISVVYASSPLTIRDFYATEKGAIFGYRKESGDFMKSFFSVRTKISNLLLTGQNVNMHGNCGVPLTAILTSEVILGKDFLINSINEAN